MCRERNTPMRENRLRLSEFMRLLGQAPPWCWGTTSELGRWSLTEESRRMYRGIVPIPPRTSRRRPYLPICRYSAGPVRPAECLSPILNLGSADELFRKVRQPHIHALVFGPLEARGVRIIHSDLSRGPGVDVPGDIFDDAVLARLKALHPRTVVCTHMLEHVVDRERLVARILELLPPGGLFFVTVPSSYHEHHDPIDTMYRPSASELAALFDGQEIEQQTELIGSTYWRHIRQRPIVLPARHLTRFFVPFLGWAKWKRSMRKLYWLFNPYKVAAISGRKRVPEAIHA